MITAFPAVAAVVTVALARPGFPSLLVKLNHQLSTLVSNVGALSAAAAVISPACATPTPAAPPAAAAAVHPTYVQGFVMVAAVVCRTGCENTACAYGLSGTSPLFAGSPGCGRFLRLQRSKLEVLDSSGKIVDVTPATVITAYTRTIRERAPNRRLRRRLTSTFVTFVQVPLTHVVVLSSSPSGSTLLSGLLPT